MKIEKRKIGIIGAGKFAFSFAPALLKNNFRIESIISRSLQSARTLAVKVSAKNYSNKISNLSSVCNLVFICVPDDQIKKVAIKISKLKLQFEKIIFIHTSGAKTSEELSSLKIKGAQTASFHLMQTFPSKKQTEILNTFTAIECSNISLQNELIHFAKSLKLTAIILSASDKMLYHLGGVFAANFLSANFLSAENIFPAKLKKQSAKILKPIAEATLRNIIKHSAAESISGPIDRGDVETIKSHVRALKLNDNCEESRLNLMSYLVQSKILLYGIKKKYDRLNSNHKKINDFIDVELKNIVRML
ncbi:MAG: DUF2520 domain-containing protein [Ignavibacteriales bacterium]|nr:DUF2520 domain-containing protein [Ignavibacteriales bacterium]